MERRTDVPVILTYYISPPGDKEHSVGLQEEFAIGLAARRLRRVEDISVNTITTRSLPSIDNVAFSGTLSQGRHVSQFLRAIGGPCYFYVNNINIGVRFTRDKPSLRSGLASFLLQREDKLWLQLRLILLLQSGISQDKNVLIILPKRDCGVDMV